jgi:hypothetical protein
MRHWTLFIVGLALLAAAGIVVVRDRSKPAPAPATAPRTALTTPLLDVQHDGAALRLYWNAAAPEVRSAKSGALLVTDGGKESRMELRPQELRSGGASWWPESRDVTFRLELDDAPAGTLRASAQPAPETKPSAFQTPAKPRPKSATVKRVAAPVEVEQTPKPESKFGRAFGKIPLLRRLKRHRN